MTNAPTQILCNLCCQNLAAWFEELSEEAREEKIQLPDEFTLVCSLCGRTSFIVGTTERLAAPSTGEGGDDA